MRLTLSNRPRIGDLARVVIHRIGGLVVRMGNLIGLGDLARINVAAGGARHDAGNVAEARLAQRSEELFFSTVRVTSATTGQLVAMGQVSYRLLEAHGPQPSDRPDQGPEHDRLT